MTVGIVDGDAWNRLLRWIGRHAVAADYCGRRTSQARSRLEVCFGAGIWAEVAGRVVIDFGCGVGAEAIEIALGGARRVIGIDIRQRVLDIAMRAAEESGVADRCVFSTRTDERVDLIFSIDSFEHYSDPATVLRQMRQLINDNGRVWISFGPPWYHPLGGHLFSVFPWAHLVFSERALIRWRSDFKSDGATRFCEVEGGLNQMTIRRFERLLAESAFRAERFETVPIRRLRFLHNRLTREFLTSVVICELTPKGSSASAH